ncbi:hypothetical protein HD554DRAFT_460956 [Boletus coccyginus]|nr:hypothetical protein HD554DRAFT_460956 [Boletus coccyginus]
MSRTYQVHSPSHPSSTPPQQNSKVAMQRQYREKEAECFNALRDVITKLTGEELQTRHEILRKAIDLLSSVSETRRQGQGQVTPPVPYEAYSPPGVPTPPGPEGMTTSGHSGYSAQSSHWSQPSDWPSSAEYGVENPYYTQTAQSHSQQYYMDSDLEPGNYQEYDESWSNNPQQWG